MKTDFVYVKSEDASVCIRCVSITEEINICVFVIEEGCGIAGVRTSLVCLYREVQKIRKC